MAIPSYPQILVHGLSSYNPNIAYLAYSTSIFKQFIYQNWYYGNPLKLKEKIKSGEGQCAESDVFSPNDDKKWSIIVRFTSSFAFYDRLNRYKKGLLKFSAFFLKSPFA